MTELDAEQWAVVIASIALLVSIGTVAWNYITVKRQRDVDALYKQREYYLRYLQYCIEDPDLDLFEFNISNSGLKKKEFVVLYHLIITIERQFLYDQIVKRRTATISDWQPWLAQVAKDGKLKAVWTEVRYIFDKTDTSLQGFVEILDEATGWEAEEENPSLSGGPG